MPWILIDNLWFDMEKKEIIELENNRIEANKQVQREYLAKAQDMIQNMLRSFDGNCRDEFAKSALIGLIHRDNEMSLEQLLLML